MANHKDVYGAILEAKTFVPKITAIATRMSET